MTDEALFDAVRKIFPPNAPYQLPPGVPPLSENPAKAQILAEMPECNALGIVRRDDAGPQNPKVRARKVKVPSSSGKEEEDSDFKAENAESSEVEYAGSTGDSDGDDDGDNDDKSGGGDTDTAARDEDEEAEEKDSSPHPLGGPAAVSSPETSPRAPPTVEEESGPVGMEVDDDAFVIAPQRREQPRR